MTENKKRQGLVKLLSHRDAFPVENPARPGTADINYVDGWIECKWMRHWPSRPETIVRIDTYTPQQRVFARRRAAAGGKVWLMLWVGHEWLLFRGEDAAEHIGQLNEEGLRSLAVAQWLTTPKRSELDQWL